MRSVGQGVDGSFVFIDSAGEAVFAIPAPRMWDATRSEEGVPERVEPVSSRLVREGGQVLLELAPSQEFLADQATVYPVTVDPDITTEVGRVRDTWVQEGEASEMWSSPKLLTGLVSGNRSRSYVQFDSAPLNGAKISKAELKLYNWFTGSCSPSPVNVRPVTQDWPTVMTWPNQPTISLDDAYLGTKSFAHGNSAAGCATDKQVAINVRSMVTEWTDEDGVTEVDHGVSVRSTEADSAKRHTFCSMNPGARPTGPARRTRASRSCR
ncbi:MAG: DNRLRE domain-containing protein [Carbonactinosporaceae bacterium]